MTVLCSDKNGTITAGAVRIDRAFDLAGRASDQRGGASAGRPERGPAARVPQPPRPGDPRRGVADRLGGSTRRGPYDFERKRLSVLVEDQDATLLITKGAFDKVLQVCTIADVDGRTVPLDEAAGRSLPPFVELSAEGYRVLPLATRPWQKPVWPRGG